MSEIQGTFIVKNVPRKEILDGDVKALVDYLEDLVYAILRREKEYKRVVNSKKDA